MPNLTAAVILPATASLGLTVFTAEGSDVVFVPMPPPEPGTTALTFTFIPDDDANEVVVEAPLFQVPAARRAALSVYFATVASRYKGITWMIHDGMAYASIHVDLDLCRRRARNGRRRLRPARARARRQLRRDSPASPSAHRSGVRGPNAKPRRSSPSLTMMTRAGTEAAADAG